MPTPDQIRAQYAKNADQLERLDDAETATIYRRLSTADDETLRAHLDAARQRIAARLAALRAAADQP